MASQFASPDLVLDVEISALQRAFTRFAAITGRSLGSVVKQNSRLIAWNLAHNAQPYGMDLATKRMGEKAVLRDIGRVYSSAQQIFKHLEDSLTDKTVAKAWYKLVKIGGYGQAEKLLRGSTLTERNAPIFSPLDPDMHRKGRNHRGRVARHRPAQIVPDAKQIRDYGGKIKERVGFGKAGWITAGTQLGPIRKVPAWITRHRGKAPGYAEDLTTGRSDPFVILHNTVRYASQILPDHAVADALRIQREKMLKHIEYVIVNSAKEAGFSASATAPWEPVDLAA